MGVFTDCCERHERETARLRVAVRALLDRITIFGLPDPHDTTFQADHHRGEIAKCLNELAKLCPRPEKDAVGGGVPEGRADT